VNFDVWYAIESLPALVVGALVTVEVAILAILLGLIVAGLLTIGRQSAPRSAGLLIAAYVSLARGTPLFIQVLFVYYTLPSFGIDIPVFAAGVIALSLNGGAYITEMLRGGLTAIPRGHIEAARALGMPGSLIWRHIKLPQLFIFVLPPLTVEFAALVKASSLLSIISLVELTRTAQGLISDSFKPVEIWIMTGCIYFVLCYAVSSATRHIERLTANWRLV
jgi:His/Glu/Gln/Arg/opine family amino acid ABC transporter permease subunit